MIGIGICLMALLRGVSPAPAVACIGLEGEWRFQLDPEDAGVAEEWFSQDLRETISLPGSLQERGFGYEPGPDTQWTGQIHHTEWDKPQYAPYRTESNFKMPFWLQPKKVYKGAAWYQTWIDVPPGWDGKRVVLTLERAHWKTIAWIGRRLVGCNDSLSTPHEYDLGLLGGGRHRLTVCVDNRMIVDVGENAHSVSDHTQSNWNGLVGRLFVTATAPVWLKDVQAYPDVASGAVRVAVAIGNVSGKASRGVVTASVYQEGRLLGHATAEPAIAESGSAAELRIALDASVKPWDEFDPRLCTLSVQVDADGCSDRRSCMFGMREVSTKGSQIVVNGRPVFLRGTLECAIFPHTGYPHMEVAEWRRILRVVKSYGLNHVRFHSWCPPEAAFAAADELGVYFQVECAAWTSVGTGEPQDRWLYREADRILAAYGNHPSFLLFAYGNEPGGPGPVGASWQGGGNYLREWVPHFQQKDKRRLVTSGSGWPLIEENDYHVTPAPRIQQWGQGVKSRINALPPATTADYRDFVAEHPNHPVVSHEIGQWCVYPNFDEIPKYWGVLEAKNFEVFRDLLEQKHMLEQAHDFFMASGKLQALCYKEEIESALRTPGFGGFQLLDLHDFPGQGTALVGVVDPFWDPKPYIYPAEYRRFCNSTVPLARMDKRVFVSSETFRAQIEIAHYGPRDEHQCVVEWSLEQDGRVYGAGAFDPVDAATGRLTPVGEVTAPLGAVPSPAQLKLTVRVKNRPIVNDWDVWVYPAEVQTTAPPAVSIVEAFDDSVIDRLKRGESVLMMARPDGVKTGVVLGFSSIFWNTAWTDGQPPHTLGVLCDPRHPALAAFPTEYHGNWQWWDPVTHAATMELDAMPPALQPIVQVVPNWFDPKKLALAFEAAVAGGKLVVCSVDLSSDLESRPVARQLRHSLLQYMASEKFAPQVELTPEQVSGLFKN